jgi:hypothetical protein
MTECFQKINISDQEMHLCSGLPFAGERTLEKSELRILKRESGFYWAKGFVLILLIPFFVAFFPWSLWHEDWIRSSIPYVGDYVIAVSMLLLIFGLPLTIFISRDFFRNEDVLMRTIRRGVVRCFEGHLNVNDKTDSLRPFLTKKGILTTEDQASHTIELFSDDNIIYAVNGKRPSKLLEVELTSAALPDPSTPCFSMPKAWGIPDSKIALERRRLSDGEKLEIQAYAEQALKGMWFLLVVGAVIFRLMKWIMAGPLGFASDTSYTASVVCAMAICLIIFYRRKRHADRLEKDGENGWALIYFPTEKERRDPDMDLPEVPVEFLPISNLLWIIDGKPAAWRRKSTTQR